MDIIRGTHHLTMSVGPAQDAEDEHLALRTRAVVLIVAAFVLLQAGNATVMSIMTVFVTETMRIDVIWAGIALGVAAGLEIPVLVLIGRLSLRFSSLRQDASPASPTTSRWPMSPGPSCSSPSNRSTPGASPLSPASD